MEKITKENPLSHSKDLVTSNIEQLKALFPEIVTEGKIDFKVLQSILGEEIEEGEEYYRFTWAGKAQARREAHKPSTGTLRPCKEDSVNWNTTQNLYLEGDNLEVLKLMQKSYAGKVKMIYIDPPYNTGKDFVYKDNYKDNLRNYQELTRQVDSDGNKLTTNAESEGRYHSNWLNMMYPRLRLARNLLKDDGVIFISLDDNEIENLKKIGCEIFGEDNFISNIIWQKKFSRANDASYFSTMHDNIVCFAKNSKLGNDKVSWELKLLERRDETPSGYSNPDNDARGVWTSVVLSAKSGSPSLVYPIKTPSGRKCYPPDGRFWSVNESRLKELISDNRITFGRNGDGTPRLKTFLSEVQDGLRPNSMWFHSEVGHNQEGKQEVKKIFEDKGYFDSPKPVRLLKQIINISNFNENDIALDFFSGSASSAHAVMQVNIEDGGKRKFIQVQLPEPTDKKSEAYKAGYKTIAEIGKERIRRAGAKIVNDQLLIIKEKKKALEKMISGELLIVNETYKLPENAIVDDKATSLLQEINHLQLRINNLDTGFKVFKLASSNIRTWDSNLAGKELEAVLNGFIDNTKDSATTVDEAGQTIPNPDIRTQEDILYEILLKYGLDLTLPIEEKEIAGKKVFNVGLGALFVCLGNNITSAVAHGIGQWKEEVNPEVCRVVFKDNGFTDVEKTNSIQLLKRFGITEIKTL